MRRPSISAAPGSIVPIAQALVALPFVIRSLTPAIRGLDGRFHEAAAMLGASPARIRRTIDLPLLARPLAVAAGLAFAVALGEFGATVFLVRADTPTLPVAAFRFLGRPGAENVGTAMALCVVLMGLVVLAALASERALVRQVAAMIAVDQVDVEIAGTSILSDVSFALATAERLAVLGPSGSGKSTLLRTIAGLQRPTRGRILSDGVDVTDRPAHARGIGFVFQDGALFPHRDVGRNVGYGLEVAGLPRDAIDDRVREVLELVGLPGLARRSVTTLSGGEAQRVGLARALAPAPRILLLDEPLGALDGPLARAPQGRASSPLRAARAHRHPRHPRRQRGVCDR